MKKLLAGILMASSALFLVACDDMTTKKNTTSKNTTTTSQTSTTKKNATTTDKKTTEPTVTTKEEAVYPSINILIPNTEFQDRLNMLYDNVGPEATDGNTTTLRDGTKINWIREMPVASVYNKTLQEGLEAGTIDMFVSSMEDIKGFARTEYAVALNDLGIDQSNQYGFTLEMAQNIYGYAVASAWYAYPAALTVNTNVAKNVWGDDYNLEEIEMRLSDTKEVLDVLAGEVGAKHKYLFCGVDDWFRSYSASRYDKTFENGKINIDKRLFEWVVDTNDYVDKGYIMSEDKYHSIWGSEWMNEQNKNNILCYYTSPWYSKYDLDEGYYRSKDENGDSGLRLVKGLTPTLWGGYWLAPTKKAVKDETIKDNVIDIIAKMTTNEDILKEMSIRFGDVCNDKRAMAEIVASETSSNPFFGGQNDMKIYDEVAKQIDCSLETEYNYYVGEIFQERFLKYFNNETTLSETIAAIIAEIKNTYRINEQYIRIDKNVRIVDETIEFI